MESKQVNVNFKVNFDEFDEKIKNQITDKYKLPKLNNITSNYRDKSDFHNDFEENL